MWSLATSAGTGLAVAGLSATYYALARKNAELERENSGKIRDNGDQASRPNIPDSSSSSSIMMTPAHQLLLKKELDNLYARDSGHGLGLNGLDGQYHTTYPNTIESSSPLMQNQYSGMQLRNIVSRVQTNLFMRPLISLNETSSQPIQDSEMDITSLDFDPNNNNSIPLRWKEDLEKDVDDHHHHPTAEQDKARFSSENNTTHPSARQRLTKTFKSVLASHIAGHASSYSEERFMIERTKSPIFYYRNPDFGKRTAGRNSMNLSEITISSPVFNIQKVYGYGLGNRNLSSSTSEQNDENEGDKEYKDSTSFIFPPVLSESRLSVCDEEQEILAVDKGDGVEDDQKINLSQVDEILEIGRQINHLDFRNDIPTTSSAEPSTHGGDDDGEEEENICDQVSVESSLEEQEDEPMTLSEMEDNSSENSDNNNADNQNNDEEDEVADPYYSAGVGRQSGRGDADGDTDWIMPKKEQVQKNSTSKFKTVSTSDLHQQNEETSYPRIVTASSTSVLGRIPPNSWIIWPVRFCSEFAQNHPTPAIVFLAAVIMLTIVLGKIFITMGNWFEYENDVDYNNNPNAILEH